MPQTVHPAVQSRVASLEVLRMGAAIVVVLGHLKMHDFVGASSVELPWFLRWTELGGLSVLLFFALSGFVLTRGVLTGARSGNWMKRRLRRLLPLYYVALLVPIAGDIVLQHGLRNSGAAMRSAALLTVMMPNAGADARNAPLWSLQVEVWLSLALWLWAMFSSDWWRKSVGVATIAGVAFALTLLLDPLHIQLVEGVPSFFAGVALAVRAQPWRAGMARASAGAVFIVSILGAPWYVQHQSERIGSVAALVFVVIAVQAVSSLDVPQQCAGLARALGVRTYALYAVHWPVILAIGTVMPAIGPRRSVLAVIGILVVMELAYRWIDVPAVSWARRMGVSDASQSEAAAINRQRKGL